jgi:hypothetical protein
MKVKRIALLLLLGTGLSLVSQAQIQHVQMRVEGMT